MDRPVNPFDRPPGDDEPPSTTGEHTFSFDGDGDGGDGDDAAFYALDGELDEALGESPDHTLVAPPAISPFGGGPVASPLGGAPATARSGDGPLPAAPAPSAPVGAPVAGGGGGSVRGPATVGAPAVALMEHDDDDEPVGLFARTSFAPGAGPRVNLVPAEVLTTRSVGRAQRRGVLVLLAVVALLVAGYVLVSGERSMARDELSAAQQRTVALTAEQAKYARAPQVYAQVDDTRAALATVMAGDVRWYQYLADLAVTSPTGLWLTSWTATVADPALASATADPAAAAASAPVATLTVSGTAANEPDVADWLDVLTATPGLTGSTASSLTRTAVGEQPVITFDSSASMTDAALSDRYVVKE